MANVAIYWDFENIHASLATLQLGRDWYRDNRFEKQPRLVEIAPIMEYAASLGNININRAYANWTQFLGYGADLQTHAIDLIQLYPRGSHGKNGADIRLATDVIEDIGRHPQIDTVLVVGGDSDYIAIAQRVRERGHRIVGIGVQQTTNRYWIASCNEFKFYASLQAKVASPQPERPPEPQTSTHTAPVATESKVEHALKAAHDLLRRAMNQLMGQSAGAPVKRALVKTMMLRLDPAFDESDLGFKTFTDFLSAAKAIVSVSAGQHDHLVSLNGGKDIAARMDQAERRVRKYDAILWHQGIQLPDAKQWDVALEETFRTLGGGRSVPSAAEYKEALNERLKSRGLDPKASDVKRVLNALWRCKLFKLDPETGGLSLLPEIDSAATLATCARLCLAQRILGDISEPPDAAQLATTLFGSISRKAEAQSLINSLTTTNSSS